MENQGLQTNSRKSWGNQGIDEIAKVLAIIINGQKAYGRAYSLKDTLAYFRLKLEQRFTADQVIAALGVYTDTHNDIPAPSDLIAILAPPPKRITEAEFVAAQKWQERNGFPVYSEALDIINDYHAQENEARKPAPITDPKILAVVQNTFKRIT